jgi:hypothetical protein
VVTSDATDHAVVSGSGATPNSKVKLTYPDGSTQTVPVGKDGTYHGTSKSAQPAGPVKSQDGNGPVTNTPFVPTPIAGTMTTKESTDYKDHAIVTGTGATPNTKITITFPNGEKQTVNVDKNGTYHATSTTPQPLGKVSAVDSDNNVEGKASVANYTPRAMIGSVYSLPNNTGHVRVYTGDTPSIPAIPGSTITITFPDGSTSGPIIVGKNGQYSNVSKTAYMPSGNVTITDTVAPGNVYSGSIPFTQTHGHSGTAVTSADANNHVIINGKGAIPGSTIIITYPDGSTSAPITVGKDGQYHGESTKPQSKGDIKITDEVPNSYGMPTHSDTITVPFTPNLTLDITNETNNLAGQAIITGVTDPNATVTVHFPQGNDVVVKADASGHFTATSKTAYQPTGKMISVKAMLGSAVKSVQKLFNQVLSKPVVTETDHGGQVTVKGYGIPGTTVSVTFSDGSVVPAQVQNDGTYTCRDPKLFPASGPVSVIDTSSDHEKSDANSTTFTQTKGPDIAPLMRTPGCGIQPLNNGHFALRGKTTPGAKVELIYFNQNNQKIGVQVVPVDSEGYFEASSNLAMPNNGHVVVVAFMNNINGIARTISSRMFH